MKITHTPLKGAFAKQNYQDCRQSGQPVHCQVPFRGFRGKNICKYFLILLFSTFFCFQPTTAQNKKAKEYLDKSSEAFANTNGLAAHFTMQIKDVAHKISESFEGDIELKGAKFHLNTPDLETWFDGKTQWVLQKDADEVNVTTPSPEEIQAINPATILSLYKQNCKYNYLSEKKDTKGRAVHEIELIPQAKNSDVSKIVLQIGSTDYLPVKIHITYKNKMENIIHIKQYQKQVNFPDSRFVFDAKKYPNVEIIDLR
ncbi:MAG: outer-membrane lipoprotein carrier protein LolA [Dysgonamonadaceae bacterium]|jgi:outer membrane lipoprotein-sorting protein|nr:outer-membrane lipoprotein carrier protein LolA [Dysgonamonadaceae bacterium]